jgi:hypothetical protein
MPRLHDHPDQEALHLNAMKALAIETGHEFAMAKQVYEFELARLQAEAHITEYLWERACSRIFEFASPPRGFPSGHKLAPTTTRLLCFEIEVSRY